MRRADPRQIEITMPAQPDGPTITTRQHSAIVFLRHHGCPVYRQGSQLLVGGRLMEPKAVLPFAKKKGFQLFWRQIEAGK